MLRSLLGPDWRKSNAHLLLLTKFLRPQTAEGFSESDSWKAVLRESPNQAIKRFIDEGMLTQADLNAQLDYKFKATELKDLLKQRSLPVSGRKEDFINRLVQTDPEGMKRAVAGPQILLCSERGQQIAENYLATEKTKRLEMEGQVLEYLKRRKFKEASVAVAAYEATQVFPRGMGIDWKNHNPARNVELLRFIFDGKPKILSRLQNDQLAALRLAGGMITLLGLSQGKQWLPPNFETGLAMDNDAAVRMLFFYATHQADMANYRQGGIVKQVEIRAAQDSCEACKRISGKKYKLSEVPELPYEHCTHEMGCRCMTLAVLK